MNVGMSGLTSPTDRVYLAPDWAALSAGERRRASIAAAGAHDAEALVGLTEAYLTLHGKAGARVSVHTQRAYAIGIRMLVADWRDQDLLHPAHDAAATWLRRLEQSGAWKQNGTVGPATPSTVRVRLAAGRTLYRALRWAEATAADPFHDVQAAPERTPAWEKRQPYPDEDIEALLAAGTAEERAIVLLGAHAGLRVAEICALRWHDIDHSAAVVSVRAGKGGKLRRVAVSRSLLAALQALSNQGDAVQPVIALTDSGARKRLRQLCRRAGVAYRGVHALRHAAGTRLVREGATLEDAARHLGHSSLETAWIYAKWADTRLRQQLTEW